jgi:hypothetical protein
MTDALVFIAIAIIAVTQFVKFLAPNVSGAWTILVAVGVGLLASVLGDEIGLTRITIAQGVLAGLGAVGITNTAENIGGKE